MKYFGLTLLAVWLIAQAVIDLTGLHFPYETLVLAVFSLTSGLVIFLYVVKIKFTNVGLLLLSVWLLIKSTMLLFNFTFPYANTVVAVLALATGITLVIIR